METYDKLVKVFGEMIVWFSVIFVATVGWLVDGYIEDLCPNCNLYQDSAEEPESDPKSKVTTRSCVLGLLGKNSFYDTIYIRNAYRTMNTLRNENRTDRDNDDVFKVSDLWSEEKAGGYPFSEHRW
ncbi:Hypothetical protein CINCED_3A001113 [Cinara cedri]|uniref:Uncharacterized protein n=1 Tax=Cinara cedri TaxID=506608 RepID=A0A5E4NHX7_9HEMI|nr:Hypothetical protein CINCED_3A001113 [Cinara cedri]